MVQLKVDDMIEKENVEPVILYDDLDEYYLSQDEYPTETAGNDYDIVKDDIEDCINKYGSGLIVFGEMRHHYAGHAHYQNAQFQFIGVYDSYQQFVEESITMQNADYIKFIKLGDKLLLETKCHDYSTSMELMQATELAYTIGRNYYDYVEPKNYIKYNKLFCGNFFEEMKENETEKAINTQIDELMCGIELEEALELCLNDKLVKDVI